MNSGTIITNNKDIVLVNDKRRSNHKISEVNSLFKVRFALNWVNPEFATENTLPLNTKTV